MYNGVVVFSSSGGKKHQSRGGQTLNVDPPRPSNCSRIGATGRGTAVLELRHSGRRNKKERPDKHIFRSGLESPISSGRCSLGEDSTVDWQTLVE